MSLLNWLKPPMKHSYMENSDSKEEDKPEEGDNDMTSYMISGLTNNSIARDASTTSNSKPSCSKQSKSFNTVWVKRRKHWLKYEKGVGMFCLLCQKYDKHPYNQDVWNKNPSSRIRLQNILNHEKVQLMEAA